MCSYQALSIESQLRDARRTSSPDSMQFAKSRCFKALAVSWVNVGGLCTYIETCTMLKIHILRESRAHFRCPNTHQRSNAHHL